MLRVSQSDDIGTKVMILGTRMSSNNWQDLVKLNAPEIINRYSHFMRSEQISILMGYV